MTKRNVWLLCFATFLLGAASASSLQPPASGLQPPASDLRPARGEPDDRPKDSVYELRTYTTAEGRLPALHKRFRDHTMRIFEKHHMRNVLYTTPVEEDLKDNTLVYLIAHDGLEAAEKSWNEFRNDPEWQKVFEESRKDGRIVTQVQHQYLIPTDYSPTK